ncbi:DUF427 domain-containing protein [Micromonospora sp. R77]|uniref:DUF427 domain-containing protein n=1 Tax=Micromonospora sp. R77 TaxID=2925836 RepID=UPI001F61A384|nr:DUF427 domain-containing protein [Micromonospora sp. R77]MCI4066479.1 DUF427 domain-containing protein [Micromonospora sp. R77]
MLEPVRRFTPPENVLTYEPSARWIRGVVAGRTVVDTRDAVLVWEPGMPVPFYAVPRRDVRGATLSPAVAPPRGSNRAGSSFHDLHVDGVTVPNAAWSYPGEVLADLVCFGWQEWHGRGMDEWYEESEQVFVHPRDPFSRVDALPSTRHVVVSAGDTVLADSTRPVLVFETGLPTRYYLPAADVRMAALTPTDSRTRCPYKGVASYFAHEGSEVAWSYPEPLPGMTAIAGLIAFYDDRVRVEES